MTEHENLAVEVDASATAERTAGMEYIETWYNPRRPHSNNQGLSPAKALAAFNQQYELAAA